MISSGGRVLMMAENDAGGGSIFWVSPGLRGADPGDALQVHETPQLINPAKPPASCEPNRGPDDVPVFLINHWVDTSPAPLPSNAAKVNARSRCGAVSQNARPTAACRQP